MGYCIGGYGLKDEVGKKLLQEDCKQFSVEVEEPNKEEPKKKAPGFVARLIRRKK